MRVRVRVRAGVRVGIRVRVRPLPLRLANLQPPLEARRGDDRHRQVAQQVRRVGLLRGRGRGRDRGRVWV